MSRWRAKKYTVALSRRYRIVLSIRRFKQAASHRSGHHRQLVITFPAQSFGIRQVAIRVRRIGRRQRTTPRLAWTLPILIIAIGLGGSGYFGSRLVFARAITPTQTFAVPAAHKVTAKPTPPSMAYSEPTHIDIPSVNINVDIVPVGVDDNGSIQMPPLFDWVAGWYRYSPTPGQTGPAVIVGHVDTTKGISVFWRLRYVKAGDKVIVSRADGTTATFSITALNQYDQASFPTNTVYDNTPDAELRLITCGGPFDTATGSYTQNTVVSAVLD